MKQSLALLLVFLVYPFAVVAECEETDEEGKVSYVDCENAKGVCEETDENGNVSYVDCANAKTDSAKPVDLPPINTMESGSRRVNKESYTKRPTTGTAKKKQDQATKQKLLEDAKKALEEAKQVREGDRQKTVTGSKLTEQYFERVKAAEERVRKAEENLN
ncbi:MAG: hypothetical protein JXA04_08235 [Gammaproteobacteria bacterium]|nr:hypothetical protein [Gammaproteobacteria bacterium]